MNYILSLDLGTTNVRAVLFDEKKREIASADEELDLYYPNPGWVEQDPIDMIRKQLRVAKRAVAKANIPTEFVKGIGIANQRETSIIWDKKSGKPIGKAIVWQDRRTTDICREMTENGNGDLIYKKTGLIIDPYFSASKISWTLKTFPDIRRKAIAGELAFGTVDSWLIWNLTEGKAHVTDATNASRTMLYNIHSLDWDDELLDLWDIPRSLLPTVISSTATCGTTAILTGSPVPISGIAGDQQAALFGQMCFEPGTIKCTYGTGCFALMNIGNQATSNKNGLLTTISYADDNSVEYALEASIFMGGATVQWLRDGLGIISSSSEVEELALRVTDSKGVILVPAFTGLGAPHWDSSARGAIFGLNRQTNKFHIARATLEGIAWQVSDVIESMVASTNVEFNCLRTDGGASKNNLLMQIQSDFIQKPLLRSVNKETTALGAALLASLGIGLYGNRDEIPESIVSREVFKPKISPQARDSAKTTWNRAIERSLSWIDS